MQTTKLIETELRNSQCVLVRSVRREFYSLIDTFHAAIESMLFYLKEGKSMEEAIDALLEVSLIDKQELKSGLEIVGLSIKDIEANPKKRNEFAAEITAKMAEIKGEFAYYAKNYFLRDKIGAEEAKEGLEKIKEGGEEVNRKYGKETVHYPDNEHWVRTALADKNKETQFVTRDYFGSKKDKRKHTEIAKEITQIINRELGTNFSFSFR